MRRVLVIGCCGAGKSTLSRQLAAITGLPRIELDAHYWQPGWQATPSDAWAQTVAALCERPAWIMDGNYTGTLPLRLARADAVIWLDYPRRVCLPRVLLRVAKDYGRVREGMPAGCPERFNLEFLRYVWNFNARVRPRLAAALERHGSAARLHRMRSDADARPLLRELGRRRAEIPDIETGEP
jgi:adenylate kinase family enzyme